MANIEKYIPLILHFEAGVSKENIESGRYTNAQLFEQARKRGFANDPDDTGGATMIGVTIGTFCIWRRKNKKPLPTVDDLKNISYTEWCAILKSMFWDRWKADAIQEQGLAELLVDWMWCSGSISIKRVQRILGVKDDGIVGPKTLAAMWGRSISALFDRIYNDRIQHARDIIAKRPVSKKYWNGWMRRYHSLTKTGFKISSQSLWPI